MEEELKRAEDSIRADMKLLQTFIDDSADEPKSKAFYNMRAWIIAALHDPRRTPVSGEVAEGVEHAVVVPPFAEPAGQHGATVADEVDALLNDAQQEHEWGGSSMLPGPVDFDELRGKIRAALEVSGHAGAAKGGIAIPSTPTASLTTDNIDVFFTEDGKRPVAQGIDHAKLDERAAFESAYATIHASTPGGGWSDWSAKRAEYEEVDVQDAWRLWQARGQQAGGAEGVEDCDFWAAHERKIMNTALRKFDSGNGMMTGWGTMILGQRPDFTPPSRVTPEWVGWDVADTGWLPLDSDAYILKTALDALTAHFDEFIGECMAGAPSAKAIARARACLPAKCVNAFKKEKPQ